MPRHGVQRQSVVEEPDPVEIPEGVQVVEDRNPNELIEMAIEYLAVLRRVGGSVTIVAQRRKVGTDAQGFDLAVTEKYGFVYNSFAGPMVKDAPQPPEEAAPDADDEHAMRTADEAAAAAALAAEEEPAVAGTAELE